MPANIDRRAFVALGLLWLSGVRAYAALDLTGIWSAEARTRGGLGAQFTFTATEATSTFGALVDFKYEIAGNLITMTSMEPARQTPPAPMTQEFKIEDNTLTVIMAGGPPQIMTRVGAPHRDADPIVGDWGFVHPTGVQAVQRFSRTGITQLSVPFKTDKGPYRLTDDTVHIQFDGVPALTLKVRREGNLLITQNTQGREIRFVKFEY